MSVPLLLANHNHGSGGSAPPRELLILAGIAILACIIAFLFSSGGDDFYP